MLTISTEVLSSEEVVEMDSVEAEYIARDLLRQIKEDSTKLLITSSPEIELIVRAGVVFAAKIEYLRKRFVGVHGDMGQLTREERRWISDLEGAMQRYTELVINALAKTLPHILDDKVERTILGSDEKVKLSVIHALPALVLSVHELKRLLTQGSYQIARFSGVFFHSVFAAQQIFRLFGLGEAARGGEGDLTNLPQTRLIFDYVVGSTKLAEDICQVLRVPLSGPPAITVMAEDTPPVVCIEYLLDSTPHAVVKANDGLAKAIALNKLAIPENFHVCFGVA
ncbi:MAG: hypothetical protein GX086_03565 [Alcaligenaceae bacterium]|nr:hypothetical protein [Alcaligenaceae bacterium]